ncbi:hypothetical protein ACS0TY_003012 [Phlomoides rotata]
MEVQLQSRINEHGTNTEARTHRCADDGHVCLVSIARNAIYSVNAISLLIFFLYLLHSHSSLQVIFLASFLLIIFYDLQSQSSFGRDNEEGGVLVMA